MLTLIIRFKHNTINNMCLRCNCSKMLSRVISVELERNPIITKGQQWDVICDNALHLLKISSALNNNLDPDKCLFVTTRPALF